MEQALPKARSTQVSVEGAAPQEQIHSAIVFSCQDILSAR